MASLTDIQYMKSALTLARRGLGRTSPNPSVGCIIVKKGVIVGRGWTGDGGRPHAETRALKQAGREAKGACAYVTLEPCAHHGQTPPCAKALIDAGVARVVVACGDPDSRVAGRGVEMLREAGIVVECGILEDDALTLNKGFILRVTQARPFVTLKTATSNDGKIAPCKGVQEWITGMQARKFTHLERSSFDAILVGIGTVLSDDPVLSTRLEGYEHQIIRVVLDTNLRIPLKSQLVQSASSHPLWIVHNVKEEGVHVVKLQDAGARLFRCNTRDVSALLALLAEQGVTRLLVEGGAKVHTQFLEQGYCDRFLRFKAPYKEMGEAGLPALEGHDIEALEADFGLKCQKIMALGEDLLEFYQKEG